MRLAALIVMVIGILGYVLEFAAITTTGYINVFGALAIVGAIIAIATRRPGN